MDDNKPSRIHMYDVKNVLMPRGSMKKESIGPYLLERLQGSYETWTDPQFGDNPDNFELLELIHTNLMGEVEQAWIKFLESTFIVPDKK